MLAVLIIIVALGAVIALAGIVLFVRGIRGNAHLKWKEDLRLDVPASVFLVVVGAGVIFLSFRAYTPGLERQLKDLRAENADLGTRLGSMTRVADETRAKLQTAEKDRESAVQRAADAAQAEQKSAAQLVRETADRRAAEAIAQAAWVTFDRYKMSDVQQAAFDKLAQKVDDLNDRLKYVRIALTAWPKLEGHEAVATFEIFNKEWALDEKRPRGAGLFDFDETRITIRNDYNGHLADVLRGEVAPAICRAAQSALVHGVSLSDALRQIPPFKGLDINRTLLGQLTDLAYVQMRLKLWAGHTLVLVRGYADGEKASWRRPLGPSPRTLTVHANAYPQATDAEYRLTFRAPLSPVEIGRMEGGGATYRNTDLPDLRAAAVAKILTALIDGCQGMGGMAANADTSPTQVEILDGHVYSQPNMPADRKARVYVVAYLNAD